MIKKTIISFITIFLVQFIFSCRCNCPGPKAYNFDFDNLYFGSKIEKYPKINELAFSVILKDTSTLIVSNQSKGTFLNSAMACSCGFYKYGTLISAIKTIKIFTKYNHDSKFNAGSDISELFLVNEKYNQFSGELYYNLWQFPQVLNDLNYEMENNFPIQKLEKQVSFYLKTKSEFEKSSFKVKFEFENGTIIETETEEFSNK